MAFIYHGVPQPVIGTSLIPLNQMQGELSPVRKIHLEKYRGREEILRRRIPLLECLWNDVVQFLPLHPQKVFDLQKKLGLIQKIDPFEFYEIDLNKFEPDKTVVFFKSSPGDENINVRWLRDVRIDTLQEIPDATIAYYKSLVGTGELPFNYQFIPHVLYRGMVDISDAKIVTLFDA